MFLGKLRSWSEGTVLGVAVKKSKADFSEFDQHQFASELALHRSISHPNICRLHSFSDDGPHRCLLFEPCTGELAAPANRLHPQH